MLPLVLLLIAAPAVPSPAAIASGAQETVPDGEALRRASPEARALWERACAASGSPSRPPLLAFQLQAEVLTRAGVQTNETRIDYRYLAPDCIRFALPSKDETGRFGPAPEQYWLKTKDQVVVLAGREFKEDRKAVDDMLALARNYVALSNPARLRLVALEVLTEAPLDLGPELRKRMRKLSWLALESPDFALVRGELERPAGVARVEGVYRVELGLREDHLPAVAIVREPGRPQADPLLVEFSKYQQGDDFKIPFAIQVHVLDRTQTPPAFAEKASQEVYVTTASLRPALTVEDFKPKP